MRAVVLHEQKKPLGIEDVELADPRDGEVTVRMTASGVCHSCLHAADGSWASPKLPMVLGDEGAGVVEKIGPGVKTLWVGDHVGAHVRTLPLLCQRAAGFVRAASAARVHV